MANVDDYFYKYDVLAYPNDISDYFLLALTPYEYNLIISVEIF